MGRRLKTMRRLLKVKAKQATRKAKASAKSAIRRKVSRTLAPVTHRISQVKTGIRRAKKVGKAVRRVIKRKR